jgi:hypothetical protein
MEELDECTQQAPGCDTYLSPVIPVSVLTRHARQVGTAA